jgi:hypothetical protein
MRCNKEYFYKCLSVLPEYKISHNVGVNCFYVMINGESVLFGTHNFDMYHAGSDMEYTVSETFVLKN